MAMPHVLQFWWTGSGQYGQPVQVVFGRKQRLLVENQLSFGLLTAHIIRKSLIAQFSMSNISEDLKDSLLEAQQPISVEPIPSQIITLQISQPKSVQPRELLELVELIPSQALQKDTAKVEGNSEVDLHFPTIPSLRYKLSRDSNKKQMGLNKSLITSSSTAPTYASTVGKNPFLRRMFRHICKQNYRTGSTFDEVKSSEGFMTINKWMVFCKQFDLIGKLSRRELIQAFRIATNFGSKMEMEEFISAVMAVELRFHQQYPEQQGDFVVNCLKLGNEVAFKLKMANLKIGYQGPTKNFFQNGFYTEWERAQQAQVEIKFKEQKRKRQLVLIQGMLPEHLYLQIVQRKDNRRLKRTQKSTDFKPKFLQEVNPQSKKTFHRRMSSGYSKIFHARNNSSMTVVAANTSIPSKEQKTPVRQVHAFWQTQVHSQSEESDDILREHLLHEKEKNKSMGDARQFVQNLRMSFGKGNLATSSNNFG